MEIAANQVMILGSGVDIENSRLTIWSEQRVDRAAEYFYEQRARFMAKDAIIVCTGGYGGLALGMAAPDESLRESRLMADYLLNAGIPHELIAEEPDSTSTLTNLLNTLEMGLIKQVDINEGNPLGIVTHPHHVKRFKLFADRLGLKPLQPIPTREQDNAKRETMFRLGYRVLLLGAGSDHDRLRAREHSLERALGVGRVGIRQAFSKLPA